MRMAHQDNYILITEWMRELPHLNSMNEVVVYAYIYGFSKDEESTCFSSQKVMAKACMISDRTLRNILTKLIDLEYIERKEEKFGNYTILHYRCINLMKPMHRANEEPNIPKGRKNFPDPPEKSSDIKYNRKESKEKDNLTKVRSSKKKILVDDAFQVLAKKKQTAWLESFCINTGFKNDPQTFTQAVSSFITGLKVEQHPGWKTESDLFRHFRNWANSSAIKAKYPEFYRPPRPEFHNI